MTVDLRLIIGEALDQPHMFELDEWTKDAACRGVDTDLFFPGPDATTTEVAIAKRVCLGDDENEPCPVLEDCRRRHFDEVVGIWYGTTAKERRLERTKLRVELGLPQAGPLRSNRPPAACGTTAGYQRHMYYREVACEACKEAKRIYTAHSKAARKAAQS